MSKRLSALCQQFKAEAAKNTVLVYVISQPPFKATGAELTDLHWLCITMQRKSVSHEIQIHLSLSKKAQVTVHHNRNKIWINTFPSWPECLVKFSGVIQTRVGGPAFTLISGFAVNSG